MSMVVMMLLLRCKLLMRDTKIIQTLWVTKCSNGREMTHLNLYYVLFTTNSTCNKLDS
jgi:hypothetical protein